MEEIIASIGRIVDREPSKVVAGEGVESLLEWLPRLFSREQPALVATIRMLALELVAQAERQNAPQASYVFCSEAAQIIRDLDVAMEHGLDPPDRRGRLWRHRPEPPVRFDKEPFIDKDALQRVATDYLKRAWHHDYIDWCLVDALAYWECKAFMGVRLPGELSVARSKLVPLVTIALAALFLLGAIDLHSHIAWWMIGLSIIYFTGGDRSLMQLLNRRTLEAMRRAYRELGGPVLSPVRVRDQFRAAEKDGVVWPTAIWPVLDAAIARNPAVWRVNGA